MYPSYSLPLPAARNKLPVISVVKRIIDFVKSFTWERATCVDLRTRGGTWVAEGLT